MKALRTFEIPERNAALPAICLSAASAGRIASREAALGGRSWVDRRGSEIRTLTLIATRN